LVQEKLDSQNMHNSNVVSPKL